MLQRIAIALSIFFLWACNEQGGNAKLRMQPANQWDSVSRLQFLEACIAEQNAVISDTIAYAYCKCMLQQLEQRYTHADSAATIDSAALLKLQQNCIGK